MDNFFPDTNYQIPETSNYFKMKSEGAYKFRVLSSAIVGYEYFNKEGKPVRSKDPFDETPVDLGEKKQVVHFWAFIVWNYNAKRIQIMEVSQKSIQIQMNTLIKNPDWGNPRAYDMTINRKGMTINDTKYTVMPSPHKPIDPAISDEFANKKIDLTLLYVGGDPFNPEK